MDKGKIFQKATLWIFGVLITTFIGILLNSALKKVNLWESFKQIITKIVQLFLNVDVVLSCLILVIFYLVYRLNKKLRNVSSNDSLIKCNEKILKNANNIISKYESLEMENTKLKTGIKLEEELKPKKEVILILKALANKPNRSWSFSHLSNIYRIKIKKEIADFHIIINKLEQERMIKEIEYGDMGELGYFICSKGLSFLEIHKQKN